MVTPLAALSLNALTCQNGVPCVDILDAGKVPATLLLMSKRAGTVAQGVVPVLLQGIQGEGSSEANRCTSPDST
jgi:hypothetical protein